MPQSTSKPHLIYHHDSTRCRATVQTQRRTGEPQHSVGDKTAVRLQGGRGSSGTALLMVPKAQCVWPQASSAAMSYHPLLSITPELWVWTYF